MVPFAGGGGAGAEAAVGVRGGEGAVPGLRSGGHNVVCVSEGVCVV